MEDKSDVNLDINNMKTMHKFYSHIFIIFLAAQAVMAHVAENATRLCVFVHGTVALPLQMQHIRGLWHDTLTPEKMQLQRKFRNHYLMQEDQLLLDEGLIHIDRATLSDWQRGKMSSDEHHKGCYPLLSSYDTFATTVRKTECQYALFGWNGILAETSRKTAGYTLYQQLCDWADSTKEHTGHYPTIEIVAHSHGGTVVLWMAAAEQEFHRGLKIELVHMMGTPLQEILVPLISSPMFGTIINGYSQGDTIQPNDRISTTHHKSHARFCECMNIKEFNQNNPHLHRYDLRYEIDRYADRVDHINMWSLGRPKSLSEHLDPLPFLTFVPCIHELLKNLPSTTVHAIAKVCHGKDVATISLFDGIGTTKTCVGFTNNLMPQLLVIKQNIAQYWKPFYRSRSLVFSQRNFAILRSILR